MTMELKLLEMLSTCPERVEVVERVATLELPDCWVAAGLVRNTVWDVLHGYRAWTPLSDIDIVYFDAKNTSAKQDRGFEVTLRSWFPNCKFSVKNQARMHLRNRHRPYRDTEHGVRLWTETCTAVGVAKGQDKWRVLCPWGLEDLMNLVIRPTTDDDRNVNLVLRRLEAKRWLHTWPKLRLWTASRTTTRELQ
jgi:hypothetical protein